MLERCYEIDREVLRRAVESNGGVSAFSRKIGYEKQRVSHWVTGINKVPESAIKLICTELNLDPAKLIIDDFKNFVAFVYPRLTDVYSEYTI